MIQRPVLVGSIAVGLVVLALGCGGRLKGVVDYDHTRDFSAVERLGFWEDARPLARAQTEVRDKIRREISEQLGERGYTITSPEQAQLLIIYHVGTHSKMAVSGSIGGTGTSATLAIELRAPDIDRSVWYGTVEQSWEEHLDADERIETAVATLLRYFPPGNAKGRPLKTSEGEERIRE